MAIVTREELLSYVNMLTDGKSDDETLSIVENVSDTLLDYETRVAESGDWKAKYDENDRAWREKYRARFFEGSNVHDTTGQEQYMDNPEPAEETVEITTYEDLFKEDI